MPKIIIEINTDEKDIDLRLFRPVTDYIATAGFTNVQMRVVEGECPTCATPVGAVKQYCGKCGYDYAQEG